MTSARDYEAIAFILRDEGMDPDHNEGCHAVAPRIADHFAAHNPLFDRSRFMHAAGSCECALDTQGCEYARRPRGASPACPQRSDAGN